MAAREYRLISSDSHVTMPDEAWQEYLVTRSSATGHPGSSTPTTATSGSSKGSGRR